MILHRSCPRLKSIRLPAKKLTAYLRQGRPFLLQNLTLLISLATMFILVTVISQKGQFLAQITTGEGPATLQILPATQTTTVGQTGSFFVFLDPQGMSVSAAEVVLTFDPQIITVGPSDITPGEFFATDTAGNSIQPQELIKESASGKIHYALGFPPGSKLSKSSQGNIIKVSYTTQASGTFTIGLITTGVPHTIISDGTASDIFNQQAVSATITVTTLSSSPTPTPTTGFPPLPTPTPTPTSSPTTSNIIKIAAGPDDADIYLNDENRPVFEDSQEFINVPSWTIGFFRFIINLPKGSPISEAFLNIRTYSSWPGSTAKQKEAHFSIIDSDNCPSIKEAVSLPTQGDIRWNSPQTGGNRWVKTNNLAMLLQQFINRPGYKPGNAVCLIWKPGPNALDRSVWAYDAIGPKGVGQYAPRLEIR